VQKIENRAASVAETAGHHIFTTATASVLAVAFGQYRWVSVMDNRTTEICRERNGKIYTFGFGPVPPAHIRCRSHIVPTLGGTIKKESLGEWLSRQPASIRKELADYANRKPLSITEFTNKVDKIKTK
jgi:SPP1 gp7 family putative phage head morphogenesis protein